MKTLFILRHAEAVRDASSDFNRALTENGRREARSIAATIREQNLSFNCVFCSTAARTRETLQTIEEIVELNAQIGFEEKIYDARVEDLLEIIRRIKDECDAVLLIGHNPALEELIINLTGEMRQLWTATMARIELNAPKWNDTELGSGRITGIFRPH